MIGEWIMVVFIAVGILYLCVCLDVVMLEFIFFFKHKTAYELRISDWSSDVCSSDLQMRRGLIGLVRDPNDALAGQFGEALRQLGETLQHDDKLRATINRFVRRAAVGIAADYGDGIVRLVSETVRGWDARTITDRLENARSEEHTSELQSLMRISY